MSAAASRADAPCALCGAPSSSACGKCRLPYCSRACQTSDWPQHKAACAAMARVKMPRTMTTGFSAYDKDGKPIPSSAFKMGIDDSGNLAFVKAKAEGDGAAAPATRRVMEKQWNCDLCNRVGASGTSSTYWANTAHAGDLAYCDECVAAGKGPSDTRGCTQQ